MCLTLAVRQKEVNEWILSSCVVSFHEKDPVVLLCVISVNGLTTANTGFMNNGDTQQL